MSTTECSICKQALAEKDNQITAMLKKYQALSDAYQTANIQRVKWFKKWAQLVQLPEDEEEERLNSGE